MRCPQRSKAIRAAVDGEPALFLNIPQEHQPIEEPLCKQVPSVLLLIAGAEALHRLFYKIKDTLLFTKERLGDLNTRMTGTAIPCHADSGPYFPSAT